MLGYSTNVLVYFRFSLSYWKDAGKVLFKDTLLIFPRIFILYFARNKTKNFEFEVLVSVSIEGTIFRDATLRNPVESRCSF
jgi:hypothetical protein